jgi:hypothetical protein
MRWAVFLSIFICVASWDSDAIAMRHGIQPLTILLAIFGLGQLFLLRRVIERELSEKVPVHCVG